MIELLPALLVALGGIALGAALGWLASHGTTSTALSRPQVEARQAAMEDEHRALVQALSDARRRLDVLEASATRGSMLQDENGRLLQRIADLEAAVGNFVESTEEVEARTLLIAAQAERDAAQRALMRRLADEATRRATDTD